MGYLNEARVQELWEKIKRTFARKEDIQDITEPLSKTLADAKNYADETYQQATGYTDQKIANLIGGAPETLDTLKEVADALQEHESVAEALNAAIGRKADAAVMDAHTGNTTVHLTASERTSWNNKLDKTGDASNVTSTFTAASSLTALTSKEKLSVSMGKLAKAVSTLISHISATATASAAGHVKVDTALSATSTNPVQNKAVQAKIASLQSSFQDGCDTLYNKCVSCGVTPSAKTPAAIAAAIQLIQSNGVTAGKNSIKVRGYTDNFKLTLNKAFEIQIPDLPDNTRRIIGYFLLNGTGEQSSGTAAFLTNLTTPLPLVNKTVGYYDEKYAELYMHPSNGNAFNVSSVYPSRVEKEVTEVTGLGTRTMITVTGPFYKTVECLDADGKWDADAYKHCYIKGDKWPAQTTTKERNVIVYYETE